MDFKDGQTNGQMEGKWAIGRWMELLVDGLSNWEMDEALLIWVEQLGDGRGYWEID